MAANGTTIEFKWMICREVDILSIWDVNRGINRLV
jgi:hypothetical protein